MSIMISWLQTVDFTRPNFYIFEDKRQANILIGMIIILLIVLLRSLEKPALMSS